MPIDLVEDASQRAEGGLQGSLIVRVVGQQPERGADQRVGLAQFLGGMINAVDNEISRARATSSPNVTACA